MSELEYRKRRAKGLPSIYALGNELDASMADEVERERRDWTMRRLLNSNEDVGRIAIKAVAAGAISYAQVEDMMYTSYYKHSEGIFGRSSDEERHTKRIRRVVAER
jgi:hypothetical protein